MADESNGAEFRTLSLEVAQDWKETVDVEAQERGLSTAGYIRVALDRIPAIVYGVPPRYEGDAQMIDYRYHGMLEKSIDKLNTAARNISDRLDGYGAGHAASDGAVRELLDDLEFVSDRIEDDVDNAYVPGSDMLQPERAQLRIRITENQTRSLAAFCEALGTVTGKAPTRRFAVDLAVWCMRRKKTRLTGSWSTKTVLQAGVVADEIAEAASNSIELLGAENYEKLIVKRAYDGRRALDALVGRIEESPASVVIR